MVVVCVCGVDDGVCGVVVGGGVVRAVVCRVGVGGVALVVWLCVTVCAWCGCRVVCGC